MNLNSGPKLLSGRELSESIYDVIFNAQKYLLILSPFIKLDDYFKKEVFERQKANAQVHIILAFGKNERDVNKSFKKEDIEYFKDFPNITIIYIPTLHAKYYGSDRQSIITSMNLIDYSFLNNIELGVHSTKSIVPNSFFLESQKSCFQIVENEGYTIFVKRPRYKKKLIVIKEYVGSEIELDIVDQLISGNHIQQRSLSEFTDGKFVNTNEKQNRTLREHFHSPIDKNSSEKIKNTGHCIRCKTTISMDINKPLCNSCFSTWVQFENPDYQEVFCISCGKQHADVSFARPSCYNCYKELVALGKGKNYSFKTS